MTETDWDDIHSLANLYGIAGEISGIAWAVEHDGDELVLEPEYIEDLQSRMRAELDVLRDSLVHGGDDDD